MGQGASESACSPGAGGNGVESVPGWQATINHHCRRSSLKKQESIQQSSPVQLLKMVAWEDFVVRMHCGKAKVSSAF